MKKVLTTSLVLLLLFLLPVSGLAYEENKLESKIDNTDNITMIFDNGDGTYDIYLEGVSSSNAQSGDYTGPERIYRGFLNVF